MDYEVNNAELSQEEGDATIGAQKSAVKAAVEAIVYVAEEPVTVKQIVAALAGAMGIPIARIEKPKKRKVQPLIEESPENATAETEVEQKEEEARPEEISLRQDIVEALSQLQEDSKRADRGLEIREIAGGYKMFTKPEHHETIRLFVRSLTPPLRLSMAALETLATIAYRQPITVPEIQAIRGVSATGVLKTLLDRKLITTSGRKEVMGRPILYKTTREFLVKFGLNNLNDLPTLEEFGEIARAALGGDILETDAVGLEADSALQSPAESMDENETPETERSGHALSLVEPLPESGENSSEDQENGSTHETAFIASGENNGN